MIAFDLDDVIIDLTNTLAKPMKEVTGVDISKRDDYYVSIPGMSDKEVGKYFEELMFKYTLSAKPVEGSIEALVRIYNLTNKPIKIITARDNRYKNIVLRWAKRYMEGKFEYNIIFSGRFPKYKYFDSDTKYFVDDALHNVDKLINYVDIMFLFDRPWNRRKSLDKKVIRIKNLYTVYEFLKKMEKFK